jgi:hypothetical protein
LEPRKQNGNAKEKKICNSLIKNRDSFCTLRGEIWTHIAKIYYYL